MKKTLKKLAGYAGGILTAGAPLLAFGAPPPLPPTPFNNIDFIINQSGPICTIFRYIFFILILIAVIFILVAAFKYLTSAGDPEKVKGANKQIIFAAVAIIVALIARVIPNIALGIIGGTATSVTSC